MDNLFVLFDSLSPSQQFFGHAETGPEGDKVSCARKQHSDC